jgi:hypothetical protein
MADSDVPITAGSGTDVHTFLNAASFHDQVVREAPSTAVAAPASWALSLTGSTSTVAADITRRSVILWNASSTGTVYLRYDGTAPTTSAGGYHDQVPPGGRLEVAKEMVTLAESYIASAASGSMNISLGTAA